MPLTKSDVPEGTSGVWSVTKFSVSKEEAALERTRATIQALQGRRVVPVPAGDYTRLSRGRTVVMSDTPSEMYDHMSFVRRARGRILVAGLGLGMVVQNLLEKDVVKHVTVVELSEDVIKLVAPHHMERFGGDRLSVVQGNIMSWCPPKGTHLHPYDSAWFDIWDTKCSGHLKDMTKLKRRFVRWAKRREFWAEADMRRHARVGF